MWLRLGLPGKPRASDSLRSPLRKDRNPSFSIFDEGRRWKDFASDEGGDAIDLIALACSVDKSEAVRLPFLDHHGCHPPHR